MTKYVLIALALAGLGCVDAEPEEAPDEVGWGSSEGKSDIYGTDSRKELNDPSVPEVFRRVGDSTAMVFSTANIADSSDTTLRLSTTSMSARHQATKGAPLCSAERFRDEAAPGYCTAFLIAPDLVATAGHCVNGHTGCGRMGFAFGVAKDSPTDNGMTIPRRDFYQCDTIVGHNYNPQEEALGPMAGELWYDWAVIKLDRPVAGRAPLDVVYGQGPGLADKVVAVGHPSGLAMKVTDGVVMDATKTRFFNTDLDIYQGNSGSPAFDASGKVRGIVVRGTGGNSFERTTQGCDVSKVCDVWGNPGCRGNHVLRPEPLRNFQADDLKILKNYKIVTGAVAPQWQDSLRIDGQGPIAFVTLNINGFAGDPSKLRIELIRDGRTVTLMHRPTKLTPGEARWTRTTFEFNGEEAAGDWQVRVIDTTGEAAASVQWVQVVVGVASSAGSVPPTPSSASWIGSECQDDAACAFASNGVPGRCELTSEALGFCTLSCNGYCPDQSGFATSFCVEDLNQGGICVLTPAASNAFCETIPGTSAQERERFIGTSSAQANSRSVCSP